MRRLPPLAAVERIARRDRRQSRVDGELGEREVGETSGRVDELLGFAVLGHQTHLAWKLNRPLAEAVLFVTRRPFTSTSLFYIPDSGQRTPRRSWSSLKTMRVINGGSLPVSL